MKLNDPKNGMKIGILGGTFDPIHEGHLALARAALQKLTLDRIIFVPAFRHPLMEKQAITIASPEARLEMVKLAIADESRFQISDCEIKRKGTSYTVDTLRMFRAQYPKPDELFFITGGDWAKDLSQWKEIDLLLTLAHFVVAKRPGFNTSRLPRGVTLLDFVPLDISSTGIREYLAKGKSTGLPVPKGVLRYIQEHKLYNPLTQPSPPARGRG